jgi:flagellar biogenesis protein FliO
LIERQALYWVQGFSVLLAVGMLMVLLMIILRWASQRSGVGFSPGASLLHIHARLPIEPKKQIWIIEAANEFVLLASHEQGVTFLTKLDPDAVRALQSQPSAPSGNFWQLLRRKPAPAAPAQDTASAAPIPTQFEVVSDGRKKSQDT